MEDKKANLGWRQLFFGAIANIMLSCQESPGCIHEGLVSFVEAKGKIFEKYILTGMFEDHYCDSITYTTPIPYHQYTTSGSTATPVGILDVLPPPDLDLHRKTTSDPNAMAHLCHYKKAWTACPRASYVHSPTHDVVWGQTARTLCQHFTQLSCLPVVKFNVPKSKCKAIVQW